MSIRIAGRGFSRPSAVKIFDETLTAAGKFDVTGIPPSYSALQLRMHARSDQVATVDGVDQFFNNDTTVANYRRAGHQAGNAHASTQADSVTMANISAASSPANYFSIVEWFLPNYADDKEKICQCFGSIRFDATDIATLIFVIHWENTAAINRVTLQTDNDPTDQLIADSRLQIWGWY